MGQLDINKFKAGAKHTVKVSLTFEENGTSSTEQIKVVYRGMSLDEGAAFDEKLAAAEDKRQAMIEALVGYVLELPDIIENGQPIQPTAEFFGTLDTYYLNRINDAIQKDRSGN